ncbi:DUF378 domain-containing protein [Candidatus Nanosalina sp. VS9-1]|uniref:DUF378 domain-containing protein n=1 Tax=Candidatus Nanosalina sp. VS9-1 TaxID=3388566 RepID=UPI0039DF612A
MNQIELASYVLVVIGALNWGLDGLGTFTEMNLNVVDLLASVVGVEVLAPAVYLLVGLAGLYQVYFGYQTYQE